MFRVNYNNKQKDFNTIEQAMSFAESMFRFIAISVNIEDEYGNILLEYEN